MKAPLCWVVSNGNPGMENQCVGLAEALGISPVLKRVSLRPPWKQLSPAILRLGNQWSLSPASDRLDGPPPDIVIATGRHSVSSSLSLRRRYGERVFRIQIQDPAIPPRYFDLVVVPRHDRLRGSNVVVTKGALTRITTDQLQAAGRRFVDRLAPLPHPRIAVLLGGSNGAFTLTDRIALDLAERLSAMASQHGASLLVTPSRRTGETATAILRSRLASIPGEFWNGAGENPYYAYLDQADAIVVTADSVNMVSEACTTGKPVYVVELEGGSDKFRRFHDGFRQDGMTRRFDGSLEGWGYPPLDDTHDVAAIVRRRLGQRGISL